jgi:hypothetical protein
MPADITARPCCDHDKATTALLLGHDIFLGPNLFKLTELAIYPLPLPGRYIGLPVWVFGSNSRGIFPRHFPVFGEGGS